MRPQPYFILVALGLTMLMGCASPPPRSAVQPNVLLIVVDDLGWVDLGFMGSSFHETPNIDRLAASSVRFSSAYAASPVCSPTRASIMTGQHPARLRITDWIPGVDPKNRMLLGPSDHHELPLATVTLAERFRMAGYSTFFAGKWHLGSEGFFPEDQGFDINRGGHHKGTPPGGYYSPYENPRLADGPEGEYLTDRLTDETIQFIQSARSEPFFAMLAYYTVHTPIQPSTRHIEQFETKAEALDDIGDASHARDRSAWVKQRQDNAAYASMVAALDENIGRLLAALDASGLSGNTIVVFTSDNGGLSAFDGGKGRERPGTSNLPLRAGKGWLYEGGIRVPLLIRAPEVSTAAAHSDVPVTSADLAPTLLDFAGIDTTDAGYDGLTLRPLLKGNGDLGRDAIYFHYPHYHASGSVPSAAIRAGDWKLIHFFETGTSELYRLSEDIGESVDLSATLQDWSTELERRLFDWLVSIDAQMPVANPAAEERRQR